MMIFIFLLFFVFKKIFRHTRSIWIWWYIHIFYLLFSRQFSYLTHTNWSASSLDTPTPSRHDDIYISSIFLFLKKIFRHTRSISTWSKWQYCVPLLSCRSFEFLRWIWQITEDVVFILVYSTTWQFDAHTVWAHNLNLFHQKIEISGWCIFALGLDIVNREKSQ